MLLLITGLANAYTFPGALPSGCSGSGGTYTCSTLILDQNTTFSDSGNVTITVNGDLYIQGFAIGSSSQSANVTFNVQASSGDRHVNLYTGASVYAAINVTTTSSFGDIDFNMSGTATINGAVNISSQDYTRLDMYDNSVINGDLTAFGDDYSKISLHSNTTVNGNVSSTSGDDHDGYVELYDSGSTINGDASAYGELDNRGTITGCAHITDSSYYANMLLYSGSSTGAVCKGTLGSCDAQSSYVTNYSGTTPPNCVGAATLLAEYHFEESSWDGTNGEVYDSGSNNLNATAAIKSGSTYPTTAFDYPARSGATGTCGYGTFDSNQYLALPNSFPNLTSGLSITAWIFPTDTSTSQRIVADDQNNYRGYALSLSDGASNQGQISFMKRTSSGTLQVRTSSVIQNNHWYFVAVSFSAYGSATVYVYDASGTLLDQVSGSTSIVNESDSGDVSIGGENSASSEDKGFQGYIDEVKIYDGGIASSVVTTDFNATHVCIDYLPHVNNLAPSATLASSNVVVSWDDINGVNDTITPASSYYEYNASNARVYANFGTGFTHQDWVEFTWSTPKSLTEFQVFWWDDSVYGRDIWQPTTAFVEYWDGSSWVSLGNIGTALHQFNSLTISNVTTTKVRISASSARYIGILEVRIFGTDSPELIAEYHLDSTSWDGTAGEIPDTASYSGGPFNGTSIGSPLPNPNFTSPAITGANGTCGYAELSGPVNGGGAFSFTGIPFDTAAGDYNTVSFWLYYDGSNSVIPISSNGYGLLINNNKFGFTSDGTNIYGTDITGTPNGWYHIVAVFNQGDITQNKLYIDSGLQTLSLQAGSLRIEKAFFDAGDYHDGSNSWAEVTPASPWSTDNSGGTIEVGGSSHYGVAGPDRAVLELERHGDSSYNFKGTVSTTPGDIVYVSFDHAERSGSSASDFDLYIDGVFISHIEHGSTTFAHFEYSGTTNSTSTVVEFRATDNNGYGVILDDIKIETQEAANLSNTIQAGGSTENSNYRYTGRLDEIKFYRGEIDQTQVTADYNATHACPNYVTNVSAHDFNCIAEQETNLANGHLYMQIANESFNIKVVALKSDGTAETDFSAASDKNISIAFLDQNNGNTPITFNDGSNKTAKTLTFTTSNTTGIVPVNGLRIPNAYQNLTCQITDNNESPAKVVNSSDEFSVRPLAFTLTSNANADAAGSDVNAIPTVIAGESFTLNAMTNTVGYAGIPTLDTAQISAHSGAYQTGTLSGSFTAANSSTGNASNTFTYSEVGYFRINAFGVYDNSFADVDKLDGDCSNDYANTATAGKYGCNFANQNHSDYFGRFIPKYFNVDDASNATTAACGGFTYFGQDGLSTQFILRATRADGGRTKNYQDGFAKLDINTWNNTSAGTGLRFSSTNLPSGVNLSSSASTPTGSWSQGQATITATHLLSRPASPVSETDIVLQASPIDSDGVIVVNNTPENINVPGDSTHRYGRLWMSNAYGSELQNLTLPLQAQYWTGVDYQMNTDDSCSVINPVNITMDDYQKNLNACETDLSGGGTMSAGALTFSLSKPGNGNNGSVTLTPNLTSATGSVCVPTASSSPTSSAGLSWFGASPAAKATFGIIKTPIIYMRENF